MNVDTGSRSLRRGLAVLDCIFRHRQEGVRVVEIMRECALERAPVYRLLSTLIEAGYVAKKGRFHYVTGVRFQQLMGMPIDELVGKLEPVLKTISEATGDAAFAVVREGAQSHCIARHIGTFPLQVLAVQVGRRQPLGVGAAGLALLSSFDEDDVSAIIAANAAALDIYGGMTPEKLHVLVNATRERGWAIVGNHAVSSTLGVGCPVFLADGTPVAAVSVAAPLHRMSRSRQASVVKIIRDTLSDSFPFGV